MPGLSGQYGKIWEDSFTLRFTPLQIWKCNNIAPIFQILTLTSSAVLWDSENMRCSLCVTCSLGLMHASVLCSLNSFLPYLFLSNLHLNTILFWHNCWVCLLGNWRILNWCIRKSKYLILVSDHTCKISNGFYWKWSLSQLSYIGKAIAPWVKTEQYLGVALPRQNKVEGKLLFSVQLVLDNSLMR